MQVDEINVNNIKLNCIYNQHLTMYTEEST
jgi:hypothetical protein